MPSAADAGLASRGGGRRGGAPPARPRSRRRRPPAGPCRCSRRGPGSDRRRRPCPGGGGAASVEIPPTRDDRAVGRRRHAYRGHDRAGACRSDAPRRVPPPRSKPSTWSIVLARLPGAGIPTRCALFAPDAIPAGRSRRRPDGRRRPAGRPAQAKPVGDRVTVRVPFLLSTHDDGRAVRRQAWRWEIAMRDGSRASSGSRARSRARSRGASPRRRRTAAGAMVIGTRVAWRSA